MSDTFGFASRLRTRGLSLLNITTDSPPSHRNHTGIGSGAPEGVTVVIQTTISVAQVLRDAGAELGALVDDHSASLHSTSSRSRPRS